jgi:Response regulator containing CheY-like receiver domain and AraC-type DNA-binding domain
VALILLIDDDGFYRGVLRQILEDGGHQVIEAANGHDGLERFRTQPPDLVITDMRMPGFDGGEVIRKLRETSKDVRILAVSGIATLRNAEDFQAAKALGANAILSKLSPSTVSWGRSIGSSRDLTRGRSCRPDAHALRCGPQLVPYLCARGLCSR